MRCSVNRKSLPSLQLLQILISQIQGREVPRLAPLQPDKDTAISAALEVLLPLDRAVVLASRLVESDADPAAQAWDLGDCAYVGYCASAVVGFGEEADTGGYCEAWGLVSWDEPVG